MLWIISLGFQQCSIVNFVQEYAAQNIDEVNVSVVMASHPPGCGWKLDTWGNMTTEDKEKTEVLNAFFTSD